MADDPNDCRVPSGIPFPDYDYTGGTEGGSATFATGSIRVGDDGVTTRARVSPMGGSVSNVGEIDGGSA